MTTDTNRKRSLAKIVALLGVCSLGSLAFLPAEPETLAGAGHDAYWSGPPPVTCFAEGTPDEYIEEVSKRIFELWEAANRMTPNESVGLYNLASRWSGTQGSPRALSWSFAPDGLSIPGGVGEPTAPNIIFQTLDSQFSSQGGRATWISRFESVFERWAALTGITYTRIRFQGNDWDDGASWGSSGSSNRGDIRIAAHRIDGAGGILAYNSLPPNGDMVLDSADNWGSSSNQNRFLRNTVAHENGHGIGILHVCPANGSKLMEPSLNTNFETIRHDDLRAGQRHYGDPFEVNNTTGQATPLGTLVPGTPINLGAVPPPAITNGSLLSIDRTADSDYYSFSVNGPVTLTVVAQPVGLNYDSSTQASNGSCNSGNFIDSRAIANLAIQVVDQNGVTVIAQGDNFPAGQDETLSGVNLGSAGTYYVRIYCSNSISQSQLYFLQLTATGGDPAPQIVDPFDYTVEPGRGTEIGDNDITKILQDDNVFARIRQQSQFSPNLPNVSVIVAGSTNPGPVTQVKLSLLAICTGAPGGGVLQRIEAYNFSTNQFDVLPPDLFTPGTGKLLFERTITTGAANYLSGSGELVARLRWFDRGAITPAWESQIDKFHWELMR